MLILLLRDAINDDRNGSPNHKKSTNNTQQASRMVTNIFDLPADGQLLFLPPNHKE